MVLVDALVAEHAADFVHLVQAAHDEALEVEFGGDTQVEPLVQGVVVGDERAGVGAGGDWHQNGGVDFDEAAGVKETADATDDAAAPDESVGDFGVGDEVKVALAVADFHIAQAVPLFGQRAHSLGEDGQGSGFNGRLAGAGTHHRAGDAEEVAEVKVGQQGVVVAEDIAAEHSLDDAGTVAQVQEGGAAHYAH